MHVDREPSRGSMQENSKSASAPGKAPGGHSFTTALAAVSFIILVVAGLGFRWSRTADSATAMQQSALPAVSVVSPSPGRPAAGFALPADVKPWVEAPILARASGYLKRRFVDIGDRVAEGKLLAEIDTPELNHELERARAQFAQAEASLELARITAERWTQALKTTVVSRQEVAEKQADFKLKTALAESARAEVHRLEKLQSFALVKAPFSGTITARNIDAGDLITAGGGRELFHLAQTNRLRVSAQVPQSMARSIVCGQSAEMTVPELPNRTFKAKVIRTAGMISAESRTLPVELEVDNEKGEIYAGSYARVRFVDAAMDVALVLPSNAVLFRSEGPQVSVVREGGKVELRTVKLGRDFGPTTEVLEGVSASDRVIVNPTDSLANGVAVNVVLTRDTAKGQ